MASVSTEKKMNKDEKPRPWYEQPGVKIRVSITGAQTQMLIGREMMMEVLTSFDEPNDGTVESARKYLTDRLSFPPDTNRPAAWRHCFSHIRRNLFKFLKIADRQGLIEQVL
jgi:hypothetical protein